MLVREGRLELPLCRQSWILSPVRLPIPPLSHLDFPAKTGQIQAETSSGKSNIKPCECQEQSAKILVMSVHFKNSAPQIFVTRTEMVLNDGFGSTALKRSKKMIPFQKLPTGKYLSWMFVIMIIGILIISLSATYAQETNQQPKKNRIIVLDPGHGGRDSGASAPENVIEKDIVMAFAKAMTERLKTSYRVILTRKDDYQVSLFDRTALANHHQADFFVSIHTGASHRSNPRGISVFYHEGSKGQSAGTRLKDDLRAETSQTIQLWEQERPHLARKSRYFVELLKKRLSTNYQDLEFYSGSAPMVVLAGARMPAVLIEMGHVTNPMDAKALNNEAWIAALAAHVCDAIDDFFSDDLSL